MQMCVLLHVCSLLQLRPLLQRDVKTKSLGALGFHVVPSDLTFRYLCLTSSNTGNAAASTELKLHPE